MNVIKKILLLFLAIAGWLDAGAQSTWQWAKRGGGTNEQEGYAIASDAAGSVYITGYLKGTNCDFGSLLLNSAGGEDAFCVKYNAAGTVVWASAAGSSGDDRGMSIAVDAAGNTYVCGFFSSSVTFSGSPSITLSSSGAKDAFIAKLDVNGNVLWAKKAGGGGEDQALGITTNGSSVFVTGYFSNTATFETTSISSTGGKDIFIASYGASSGALSWVIKGGSSSDDEGDAVATDGSYVYAAGSYKAACTFSNITGSFTNDGNEDAFVVKYDLNGNGVWKRKIGGSSKELVAGIAVSSSSLYVAGSFTASSDFYNASAIAATLTAAANEDAFVAKYDAVSGNVAWANSENGSDQDNAYGVCVDASGNVWTSGSFKGDLPLGSGPAISAGSKEDVYVTQYDAAGNLLYGYKAGGTSEDESFGIAYGNSVCITGYFKSSSATFGTINISSSGGKDVFVARFGCTSTPGTASASASAVCAGSSVTLTLTGYAGSVQWQSSPASAGTWNNITGATSATLTLTPAASTDYRARVTQGTCNTASSTIATVTVNPLPVINVTPASPSVCQGDSVQLTASGASTYTWSPGTGLSSTNTSIVKSSPAATTAYTVTGTDNNGCVNTTTVNVQVKALPTVGVTPTTTAVCLGSSTPLAASGAASYAWSPATGLNSTTGNTVTSTPASTTTYTITGTGSNGCINTTTATVQVNQLPTINVTTPASTICFGSTTQLTASGANSYTWSPATGLSSTNSSTTNSSPASTTTYTVTGTDNNGCVNTTTATVQVNALPVLSVTPASSSVCLYDSTQLAASGATSYVWSPAAGLSSTNSSIVNSSPASTTTYTVTGTDNNGCMNTTTVNVQVKALPSVIANPSAVTICSAGQSPLSAAGASSYTWQPAAGLNATTGQSVIASPTATTTYTITGTSSNGCSSTAIATVNVDPQIANNTITADQDICSGAQPMQLTGSAPSGGNGTYSYLWEESIDSIVWLPAQGLDTLNNYAPPSLTDTIYYRRNVASGACISGYSSQSNITVIHVQPPLGNNIISADQTMCSGSIPSMLTGSAASGGDGSYAYLWMESSDGSSWVPAAGSNSMLTYSPPLLTDTMYYLRTISSGACNGSFSSSSNVVVMNVQPVITGNIISSSQAICMGSTPALLNGAVPSGGSGAYTYVWEESNDGVSWTQAQGTNSQVDYAPGTLISDTWYRRMITSGMCSHTSQPVIITMNALPSAAISGNDTICQGDQSMLTVQLTGASPWTFTYSDGTGSYPVNNITSSPYSLSVSPATTSSYTIITVGDYNGCSGNGFGSAGVTVYAKPVSNAGSDESICGLEASLSAIPSAGSGMWTSSPGVSFSDASDPQAAITIPAYGTYTVTWTETNNTCSNSDAMIITSYEPVQADAGMDQDIYFSSEAVLGAAVPLVGSGTWSIISGSGSIADPSLPASGIAQLSQGDVVLQWSVTNGACPAMSDSLTLHVHKVIIPTGFSPNSDNSNDLFVIEGIENFTSDLTVFDRWGNEVYKSAPYTNQWDGSNMQGELLPDDTYFYVLNIDHKPYPGYVVIKRK